MSPVVAGRTFSSRRVRALAVAAAIAALVAAANASRGAYFSQSWGWVALAFLVPTTLVLVLERATTPGRPRLAFAGIVFMLGVWVALSSIWSISPSGTSREVERILVYIALALAVAVVLRRGDGPAVVAGALGGSALVCVYALTMRLFPDKFDTFDDPHEPYRLAEPLGYYNALGLLAAMALLLAFGVTAHTRRSSGAMVAGAIQPLLAATLYFTFSRGAWVALGVGLAAVIALDSRRLSLAASMVLVCPAWIAAVIVASQQGALTTEGAPAAEAVRDGRGLALSLALLVGLSAVLAWAARRAVVRLPVSTRVRRTIDVGLAVGLAVGVVVAVVLGGGPKHELAELKRRFDAEPVWVPELNTRLFSVSGNRRSDLLQVGWDVALQRPVIGSGAGTFEYAWYERRPDTRIRRDGHSLYLESLAELGAVGFALVGATVVLLLAGLATARRTRHAPAATGAFVAWAAASALDWHWEMVGVTSTAFLAGSVGLLAWERGTPRRPGGRSQLAAASLSVALSAIAVVSLVGNQALFAAREAVLREEWADARRHAERARALLPWSFEPDVVLGDAYAGLGRRDAALRAYRDAVATDERNWAVWFRLAQVARGDERARAYATVHQLNPREGAVPGEGEPSG